MVGSTANPDYDQIHRLVQNALVDPAVSSTPLPSSSASSSTDPSPSPSPSKSPDLSTKQGRAETDSETAQKVTDVC